MVINIDEYRKLLGIERSSERLPAGSQSNSDLSYRNALQQYRSEQLDRIEATWLNPRIPWKIFITLNVTLSGPLSADIVKDAVNVMLKMAAYRHRAIMSAAIAVEPFPSGNDVHVHIAVGSEAKVTTAWFEGYLNRFPELRHQVLNYSDPAILSYVLKTTNTELVNCEPYLKDATTSQERRRLRRMQLRVKK